MRGQRHAPAALYPRERPGTHFTGSRVGPRAGLDGRKVSSQPGFDRQTVQLVASRYIDYANRPTPILGTAVEVKYTFGYLKVLISHLQFKLIRF